MKATVKETKAFKPITIELVIESEVELAWLKAISNTRISTIKRECSNNLELLNKFTILDIDKPQMDFYDLMKEL